jgi:Mn-dependent DtxR family transcriptional regulator
LDKLHHLYNQKFYPIQRILNGNAIKANKESVFEMVELLEKKEYIQVVNNRTLLVQLSKKGKEYVDNKRNFDYLQILV